MNIGLLLVLFVLGLCGFILGPTISFESMPPGIDTGDVAWLTAASCLVLLMTPGLAFFYGGMVRSKNVVSTMFQSFVAMGVVGLFWVTFGFSLAFGDSMGGIIGNPFTFMFMKGVGAAPNDNFSSTMPFALFCLFQMKFAVITPALVTGAFAERIKFSSYIIFMLLFSVLVYCPLAHMTWHSGGLLLNYGVLDFAGGTVVHMAAGFAALAAALAVGKRKGYGEDLQVSPANIPFVLLGTGMLWFGWFGFNGGSSLGANPKGVHACLTTTVASASAMLAWLLVDGIRGKKPSCIGACIGAVVGLVAITPGAGFVSVGASLLVGIIGSTAANLTVAWKESAKKVDDSLDVFACHGVGGLVGMLLTGAFAAQEGGLFVTGDPGLFIKHVVAAVGCAAFIFIMSYIIMQAITVISPLRVADDEEVLGLDRSQHDEVIDDVAHGAAPSAC